MSGHSKWAQIKHKKAASDQKRGALFSKIASEISVAARASGPDPAHNARLRAAIERARASGLPKENIERALSRASGEASKETLSEFLYEALAADGAQILIEGITDNTNRSHAEIKKVLAEHGARFADPGSLAWNFEKEGTFYVRADKNPGKIDDEIELALIDAGVERYEKTKDGWLVLLPAGDTERARSALESSGVSTEEADYGFVAKNSVDLSAAAEEPLATLVRALSEHPDIHAVYTNADSSHHS